MTVTIKTTIGFSISMKSAYQTQTKQYNDHEYGFVVNKTYTLIKKTVHKKV